MARSRAIPLTRPSQSTSSLRALPAGEREGEEARGRRQIPHPTTRFASSNHDNWIHVKLPRPSMTTLVQTRQPLQVLSMSHQPKRRRSERVAGAFPVMFFPQSKRGQQEGGRALRACPHCERLGHVSGIRDLLTQSSQHMTRTMETFNLPGQRRRRKQRCQNLFRRMMLRPRQLLRLGGPADHQRPARRAKHPWRKRNQHHKEGSQRGGRVN